MIEDFEPKEKEPPILKKKVPYLVTFAAAHQAKAGLIREAILSQPVLATDAVEAERVVRRIVRGVKKRKVLEARPAGEEEFLDSVKQHLEMGHHLPLLAVKYANLKEHQKLKK